MYPLILYLSAVVPPASDSPGRLKGGNPWPQILTESPGCFRLLASLLALGSELRLNMFCQGVKERVLAQDEGREDILESSESFPEISDQDHKLIVLIV